MSSVLRIKPSRLDTMHPGRKVRRTKPISSRQIPGLYLNRFTVLWVQRNGVTFNTAGFFARAFIGGRLVSTAAFDRRGVVQFNNIGVLTNRVITIRIFNSAGILFRTRTVPAGVEAFAVIG